MKLFTALAITTVLADENGDVAYDPKVEHRDSDRWEDMRDHGGMEGITNQRYIDERNKAREETLAQQSGPGRVVDEFVWGIEDEWDKDWGYVRDEASEIAQEFNEMIPTGEDKKLWDSETWTERAHNFRWYWHFLWVTIPFLAMDIFFAAANLYLNIFRNNFWAGGNFFLVYNTGYQLFQSICGFLLMAEFPIYMVGSRAIRAFSFGSAYVYNTFYFFFAIVWFVQNYKAHIENEGKNPLAFFSVFELLVDMFFGFNLIMNLPNYIINAFIICKEVYFQFETTRRTHYWGGEQEELKLNLPEFWRALFYVLEFFNPLAWIHFIFNLFKGEDKELNDYYDSREDFQKDEINSYLPDGGASLKKDKDQH